jgi:hypothetical protein
MIVFLMWARNERSTVSGRSFFERARRENLATLVASNRPATREPEASLQSADGRTIDDDAHLAAYNEYLARLNRQHDPAG